MQSYDKSDHAHLHKTLHHHEYNGRREPVGASLVNDSGPIHAIYLGDEKEHIPLVQEQAEVFRVEARKGDTFRHCKYERLRVPSL
jgi:hypothetical protein